MQKVNVDVYIWNELRSNDRFGLNTQHVGIVVFVGYRQKRQKRHFTHMSFSFILACGIFWKKVFGAETCAEGYTLISAPQNTNQRQQNSLLPLLFAVLL